MNEIIFNYLNSFAGQYEWLDIITVFFAETLGVILLLGLLMFLFSHEHKGKGFHNVIVILAAAVFAWALSWAIKHAYPFPRPFIVLDNVNQLIDNSGIDSFPSGHATFFSAIATALYFYHKKIALFYALGALSIGVSRIIAGVHWPLDIVVGYILGGMAAAFVYYTYQTILNRFGR